jgi:two-component system chemotaxis response regulator CheY
MPTVLIVDDSKAMRMLTSYMLMALGVTPVFAEDGVEALEICAREMPDAVLLNWYMPAMDGPSFQERLTALSHNHLPKVIFCTADDDFDKIAEAVSAGVDGLIIKPFDLNTLSYSLEKNGVLARSAA